MGTKIDYIELGWCFGESERLEFASLKACNCYFDTTVVREELPEFEAAGLIGRAWMWKPNKLPRKAPKIAEGKIRLKAEKPRVSFPPSLNARSWFVRENEPRHWQLMGPHSSHRTLGSFRRMLLFIINLSLDNVCQHKSLNKFNVFCFVFQG